MQQDLPANILTIAVSAALILALIVLLFRFLSQKVQKGSRWYDIIEIEKNSSPLLKTGWEFLTKYHQEPKEFPLASITLLVVSSSLFWIWTLLVLHNPQIKELDLIILDLVSYLKNDVLDAIFVSLTLIGNEAFLYCSFILLVGFLSWKKQFIAAIHMAAGGLITAAITHGFKAWFAISRPELVLTPPSSFAYPSGHSSGAVIFWGLLASLVAQDVTKQKRWQVYLLFFIPMFLIALSRVFLGVHWFSDIVGGILLGLAICGLTRISYSRYNAYGWNKTTPLDLLGENRKELVLFFITWGICALVYQWFLFESTAAHFQIK